jgi:phage tail sheath gpL-like
VNAAVTNALAGVAGGPPVVVVTCATPTGGACTIGAKNNGNNVATVTVTLNYTGITGMFNGLTNAKLVSSSYMRIEG